MSQKIYLVILKTGILAGFISFFLVAKNLLFPFITSKQIYFNILIEILFVVWLAFIIKYPHWQPFKKKNKNLITIGLGAFFAALLLSLLGTVDVNMSFWGDIERMLGIFHLLHFLVFYFIIITVMRNWRDWKILLLGSVIASSLVALRAVNGDRLSFIGNAAYVAGLMIFNIYFAFLLMLKEKSHWRWVYLVPILIMLQSFSIAAISGAYVGLGFSFICFLFILGILHKNRKIKIGTLAIFLLLAGAVSWTFINKDHPLISKIEPIQEISIQKNTFQTRLISWRAAVKEFKNNWILGVGHGNYSMIFDKHFDPHFFDYTRNETYFDRAHNNVLDIASTTGIVGITTYMLIFVFMGIYLVKAYKKGRIGSLEFSLLAALAIAYFVQNLAVFDSLVTYVSLMVFLGYIHWLANHKEDSGNTELMLSEQGDRGFINKEIFPLFLAGLAMFAVMWNYNMLPLKMLKGTIEGQRAFGQRNFARAVDEYRDALKYDTPLDRDSRFTLVRSAISNYWQMRNMKPEERDEDLEYIIEQAEENVALSPFDSLLQMQLARIYDVGARYHSDKTKQEEYSQLALNAVNRSIEASPGRIPVYFVKSQILINRGQRDKAIETLEYAAGLNENYFETQCQLAQAYLMPKELGEKDEEKGFEAMDKCLENGGSRYLAAIYAVKRGINHYAQKQELDKVVPLYEQLVKFEPNNVDNWINMAKLYQQQGKYKKAIEAAKKARKADPSIKEDIQQFIKQMEKSMGSS